MDTQLRAANTSCLRSDRFWLLELRVSRTFRDQLRPQLSGHGYPTGRAANTSCACSDRFWLVELRVSRTFLDQLRPQLSGHGYPAQRAANGSWRGTPARLTLHPRKREHRVSEKTEDHDVRPDQKLRSGSQSRSRQDILPPPRHNRGTRVPAGVEIPAGCPAVAAMKLDQQ